MELENAKRIANSIKNSIQKKGINFTDLSYLLDIAEHVILDETDNEYALKITDYIKKCCVVGMSNGIEVVQLDALRWRALKVEAPIWFESFLIYMEKNRKPNKRFYQPRQRTLGVLTQDLQDLEDRKIDFLGISLPARTGKSSLCIFFLAWIIGKRPSSHNAMSGHSGILADRFYLDVFKLTESEEYTFREIFPSVSKPITSADKNELKYDEVESFATLTCRGVDGTWTGAVDISANGYLYVDDMIRDRTESLSPIRLEKRYQDYLNVLVDRKNDGARELMVGTRWNLLDPLGRCEEQYKDNPRYRFRKIPALDENGESNFQYDYGLGFSTEYYEKLRERLDKNEWEAKYQQNPFVREGLLLPEDELRTYNGVLPDGEYITLSACDVAWGGGDSVSMPFGLMYQNGDIYIPDWVFSQGDKTVTRPIVVQRIIKNNPNKTNFEANNGGEEYKDYVDTELRKQGFKTNITSTRASNQISKMAKFIQYAPDIKATFIFLDKKNRTKEYQNAMNELTMTVSMGKNTHDDAMDSCVQLYELANFGLGAKITIPKNPFF